MNGTTSSPISYGTGDKHNKIAHWRVAYSGHEGVVKALLARDGVSSNTPGGYHEMPLSVAAKNGHEGIVKLLLRRDGINTGGPGGVGKTALLLAAQNGHKELVKTLVGLDIDPNRPDECGRTPL